MENTPFKLANSLLNNVCTFMDVKPQTVKSKSKKYPLPDTRHLFIYIALNRLTLPINYITGHVNLPHTSKTYVETKVMNDNTFKNLVIEFEKSNK